MTIPPMAHPKVKYLVALGDKALRAQTVKLLKIHFGDATIYEAKDGVEAIQKLESDVPHVLILGEKLARRSHEQIISSLYSDAKTQEIQTVFVGPAAGVNAFQDLVTSGRLHVASIAHDLGPLLAAIYRAANAIKPASTDFKFRYMQKGEIFLREGDKGDTLYLLMRGRLTAFLGDPSAPKNLGQIGPGEFVGEMAYINREPRSASVIADEDSELVEFNIDTFDQIVYRKPTWMKALLQTLSRRVKRLNVIRSRA